MPFVQRLIIDLSSNNISILKIRGSKILKLQGWIPALYLSNNFISEIEINAFHGLNPVVLQLYLSSNLISHIKKETFCNLAALQIPHLDRNKLRVLYFYMFKMLRKLNFLSLYGNEIKFIGKSTFSIKRLKKVDLGDNNLVSVTWDMIHSILEVVEIHNINLVGNNLTSSREICWIEKGEHEGWITANISADFYPDCPKAGKHFIFFIFLI